MRIFEILLEYLLYKTGVICKNGEPVCIISIQRMQILNEADVTYGRRIDLIVTSNLGEEEDIELCSIEFKRSIEAESMLRTQQNKNIRVNACIINDTSFLVGNTLLPIVYLDFSGKKCLHC